VLSGGDDYELVFTAPPAMREAVAQAAQSSVTTVRRVGTVTRTPGLALLDAQGQPLGTRFTSFDHFAQD
jgi:thiamine-monophosphate kinase